MISRRNAILAATALAVAGAMPARAQQPEIRISRTTTMAYLPLMVAEHEKLIEKHAAALGVPNLKVTWALFTGPAAQIDALFSGNVDVVAVGSNALITLWARTKGTSLEVKGVSAMSSMPIALNTRNPDVKSIKDFTDKDRIAVPSVQVSHQALLLQMASAKLWGFENHKKLDHLTVGLGQLDAVAAMLSPGHEVTSDFCTPPFLYIEREQPGIRTVLTMKEILDGEKGTIGTAVASSKFRTANPTIYKALHEAIKEAMDIIAKDKERAIDGYVGATGDRKTARRLLMQAATDPDAEFTMTPHSMKAYADFMFKTGRIKQNPASWHDMFYDEVKDLPGS